MGVIRSIIRSVVPGVEVIDLTHEIAPHDIRGAGLILARSAQYLAPGVVLGVVDPGIGSERRRVAIEVGDGQSVLVGPDNGIFAPAVAMVGGATRAVELSDPAHHLPAPGLVFDGRDVFAPVAAHLCAGVPITEFGPEINTASLMPGILPVTHEEDGMLQAEVLWQDRYGNLQLNVGPEDLAAPRSVRVGWTGRDEVVPWVSTFAEVAPGGLGLLIDSYGLVALVADRTSAADVTGLGPGSEVILESIDDSGSDGGGSTPVSLGPTRS
ncbi:MAG: SAM-dependent chlorinase/fluorinase [Actinomycetia bacterium]|nr:SAM-dependent chlorinase/fluorinase [Actinomycetes bacterium]